MEIGAQHERDRAIAVPARLEDLTVGDHCFEGELQPGGRTARVDYDVPVTRRPRDVGETNAQSIRNHLARRVDVDQSDLDPGDAAEQSCDTTPDHAGADDGHPVADKWTSIPEHIDSCFDRAREHGATCRYPGGNRHDRIGGDDER
ncbi:hypothetical protein [Cryobacterium sp. 10C3]|uniref:hypothetical protein n=1 Tax=Cryobacterium sp. 10C3 TaxID=3048577 RepID=UPI002AB369AE|nr:hypothetical protein [Cryobacterium sp. 10C3]MDY7556373.1 hypothetical protein [Cryobacterium sp. 10C3]